MDATGTQLFGARLEGPGSPALEEPSQKSYTTAVVLSSLVGFVGLQHFYLGRRLEGLLDVGLTIGWVWSLAVDSWGWFALFVAADGIHALTATILLLTGSYKDGEGRRVCYPGQRLRPRHIAP